MTFAPDTAAPAEQSDELVARLDRAGLGARMASATGAVHFPRGNPRQPDARTLGAPHWTIAIPDMRRGASEGDTGGEDRGCEHGG